ncbi:MAG: site-specific integrase [candidate division NC10 bacterium]
MQRRSKSSDLSSPTARAPLPQRREPYWARVARGQYLGYRKGKTGGTWIARWQAPDGAKRYGSIGKADDGRLEADGAVVLNFDQAQVKARDWFRTTARREAGLEESLTVLEVIDEYLDYLRREKSALTAYDTQKRAARYIIPTLGACRVADLTTVQIRRWRDGLVPEGLDDEKRRRAKDSANRILTMLKAPLNRLWREGRVPDDSAWRRIAPFEGVGESRKVFLTEVEAQRLVNSCHEEALRNLVTAGLLTGARLGEIAAARVADVDPEEGIWTVRAGKTGRRDVFLSPEALSLFEQLCLGRPKTQHVFLRSDGAPWAKSQHYRYFAKAVQRAELDPATTFYSLRHSYVSHALKGGIPTQLLAENVGTSGRMIEKHYGKFIRDDRRRMLAEAAMQLDSDQSKLRRLM